MGLIFEIIVEVIVGGSVEGANDNGVPKGVRIGLLILATVIYIAFAVFLIGMAWIEYDAFGRVLSGGIVILFVGVFARLWYKVIKAKK